MKFRQLYSGSKGNAYVVEAENGKRLLLECGVTWKLLQEALDYKLDNIEACFVTHSHKDHSKALNEVLKAGIDVYASKDTLWTLGGEWATKLEIGHYYLHNKTLARTQSFEVFAFDVPHDVPTLGFIVRERATDEKLLFVIDTKTVVQKFPYPFSIIAIECAYDAEILKQRVKAEEVDEHYARRLLDSHMEWRITELCLQKCNRDKLREIHLLHISGGNIDKKAVAEQFEKEFMCDVNVLWR